MALGILVFSIPVVAVALLWLWRSRRIGRSSNILPVFLLGYFLAFCFKGIGHDADIWSKAQGGGDLLWLFVGNIVLAFIMGGIGLWILMSVAETFPSIRLFDKYGCKLVLAIDSVESEDATANRPAQPTEFESIQLARRLAIEECAEEAYRFLVQHDRPSFADYDDVEGDAVGVREFLLSLTATEDTDAS